MAEATLLDSQNASRARVSRHWLSSFLLMLRVVLIIACFTGILMGYVWSRLTYLNKQTELISLTKETRLLEQEIYKLRLKLATLKQPARLDQLAKERWQLQIPTAEQIIMLEDPGAE
ncbi:hypothetical protein ACFLRA_00250 [Bdellovibrionota bacterium]